MEGTGSRPNRSTSRYGSAPPPEAQAVFNGPVRKWKKQWVSCQSNDGKRNGAPPLLLYKWTAVSDTDSAEEPRKRRFRYLPIVSAKNMTTGIPEKVSDEAEESNKNPSSGSFNVSNVVDGIFQEHFVGDIAYQKLTEDESDVNKTPNNGSYSGGDGTNNRSWPKRMVINWEDDLKSN